MKKKENLIGKYYRQESRWDDSIQRITFESRDEVKTVYKVVGVHTQKENAEDTLYNVREIRFHSDEIIAWDTKVYTARHLKECYKQLPQGYVKKLSEIVMDNILNNI
ncbi:MAG: hypothetical protein IJ759_00990 [Bacteroidales bacterium]|nr:hypothetical protein [Bacteroidales bacterium]